MREAPRANTDPRTLDKYDSHRATGCVYTHINNVRQIVDVIFEDAAVGGLQRQKVLIPGLDSLQPVLCVLSLSLIRERE